MAAWSPSSLLTPRRILFVALLLTYMYFIPTGGWNENTRLDLTRAIVEQGRLDIDSYHLNTGDKSRCGLHHCTDKAPGASFLATIPYTIYSRYLSLRDRPKPSARVIFADARRAHELRIAPGDRIQINTSFVVALYVSGLVVSAIPTALAALGLVLCARRLGAPPWAGYAVALVYALGTPAFPYATVLFGHQLAGAALFGAFALAWTAVEMRADHRRQSLALLGSGGLAGLAVLSEYPVVIPAAAIGVYALARLGRRRRIGWYVLGAVPFAVGLMAYLTATFGSPFSTGYSHLATSEFAEGQSVGLLGVTYPRLSALVGTLVGRFRGLFYISPVLVLAIWGWVKLWRRDARRAELVLAAGIVLYGVLLNASYYMWSGGAAAGPRHVVPFLAFLCLPLVGALEGRVRWVTLGLLAPSALNALALTGVGVNAAEFGDILLDYAWPTVFGASDHVVTANNLGRELGLPLHASLIPILALWGVALTLLAQSLSKEQPHVPQ